MPTYPLKSTLAYPSTYVHTDPHAYKPTCLPPPYIPTHRPTYLPTPMHTYLPTYISPYVPNSTHTHTPTYAPNYLRTYLPTCLPTYLPTYLHTYPPPSLPPSTLIFSQVVPMSPVRCCSGRCTLQNRHAQTDAHSRPPRQQATLRPKTREVTGGRCWTVAGIL